MLRSILLFTCSLLLAVGCTTTTSSTTSPNSTTTPQNPILYEQLGGGAGLEKIVDSFIDNIGKDPQILPYFADAKVSHFRTFFLEHLCAVSDGPCTYTGDSMEDIHTGMHIDEADFNRVVELLVDALEQNHIPFTTQNRLLERLAPLRGGVIHR